MFERPETNQPEQKVVQFPFPEKADDFRAVHVEELDQRFAKYMDIYKKMKTYHLTNFNYTTLQDIFVNKGGISQEVFEKYLKEKGMTWGEMRPMADIEKEEKRRKLFEKYPPKIDEITK